MLSALEHLQMDFLWLPSSLGFEYGVVFISLFLGQVEALPGKKVTALIAAKMLLGFVFSTWVIPTFISSDWYTHFMEIIIK